MNIKDILDINLLEKHIQNGLVQKKKHPQKSLFLYTYTHKCQTEWAWDKVTIQCRGLITKEDGTIVARPFKKFFTPDQYRDLRSSIWHLYKRKFKNLFNGPFTVTEKMDGSLGILYHDGDDWAIATKGSFKSEQAIKATQILRQKYPQIWPNDSLTYLFEIIYPENQIVVDYQGKEDLVLIGVIDTDTGLDIPFSKQPVGDCASNLYNIIPSAPIHQFNSFDEILTQQYDNREGFVVRFEDGFRVKVKFAEYLRLHKIMTNFSPKKVWECLYNDEPIGHLLNNVPTAFACTVANLVQNFTNIFHNIRRIANKRVKELSWYHQTDITRKQVALAIKDHSYKAVMFKMMDNKNYDQAIWKLVWKEYQQKDNKNNVKLVQK